METRRRGRDARASSENNRSSSANAVSSAAANVAIVEPPSTRSRTRRASASQRSLRSTRAARSSSSGIVTRSTSAVAASSSPSPGAQDNGPDRSAKRTSFRRRPLQSTSTISNFTTLVPATRKRTRSGSRIETEPSRHYSADASGTLAPPLASAANSSRPSKRPRRAASIGTLSKSRQSHPTEAGPAQLGVLSRRTRSMSSSRPGEDGEEGNSTPGNVRQDDEGPNSPDSDRGNPTTLQGLLRRLGADLSDILPGNTGTSHSRLQQLRTMIASPEDTDQQIDALSEVCEFLSVGTEESLVSFSVNLFVGPLVNLLRTGSNVEVKIYAARALTHMMEALPSSASAIAINGAADPLCQNLLSIEYIDLAEQSLSVLHKLSVDYPQQIVTANGFQAVLSFIDFFSLGVQRVAASTVCNLCRLPRGDAMEMINGALPAMMRLLSSDDQRIRESAVLGFARLAEAFRASSEKLEALCGKDALLLDKILGLIVPSSPPAISPQSHSSALRLLALLARGSAQLGLRILSTRALILKLQVRLGEGSSMQALDCLNLADSLLPDIPEPDGVSGHPGSSSVRARRRRSIGSFAAMAAVDTKRREQLEQNVELLRFFGRKLFDTLMKFYVSSADSNARRLALSIMSKFIAIASEQVLSDTVGEKCQDKESLSQMISPIRFCPFVAALLGENSSKSEALVGLAMAAAALQKLPSFKENFVREGVIHEIVRLASLSLPKHKQSGEVGITRSLSGSSSENQCRSQERNRPNPESSLLSARLAHSSPHVGEMESVWSAVAALQRGALNRVVRGDTLGNARRVPSRPVLEFRAPTQSVQEVVPKAAQSILTTYLGADAEGNLQDDVLKNSVLQKLLNLCNVLQAVPSEEQKCEAAVEGLFDLLTAPEGLTVFEVSRSGILEILSKYLSPSDSKSKVLRISSLTQRFRKELGKKAFSALVTLALGVLSSEEKLSIQINESSQGSTTASVSSGLRQLTQPFKLRLRKAPSETGPGSLRDYSQHVVLIEPLATMSSVQDFLWPRVRESSNESGIRRQRSLLRHRSAEAEEEDGVGIGHESGDRDDNEESEFREDRFGELLNVDEDHDDVRDRMEEDGDEHNSEGSDEEVSSGEEDVIGQEGGESDEHDHDGADALDVDQLGSSLPPFEVDHDALGEAPNRFSVRSEPDSRRGSASNIGSDVQRSETTFRSYAAALAANIPRGDGEESTVDPSQSSDPGISAMDNRRSGVSSDQRLLFSLNGRPLHHNSSILSAVIQSASQGSGMGPRVWSEVHTLSYSKYQSGGKLTPHHSDPSRSDIPGSGVCDGSGPVRRSLRLQESKMRLENSVTGGLLPGMIQEAPQEILSDLMVSDGSVQAPSILTVSALPASVSAVVNVLKLLYWIYEVNRGFRHETTYDGSVSGDTNDATVKFVSHRLSAKLMRQLSDPLALCSDVIPPWCFTLTREAPFLIPFEARRILFQSTSLGIPRALHLLQTRSEMAGLSSGGHRPSRSHREGEARIARITRQKVRVHRNRILESAIKVMNIYSPHGTVLEVEYFGEVGTGLGPTLEFYTLASREIQRTDLGLWRCNTGKEGIQKETGMTGSEEPGRKSERIPARTTMLRRRNRRNIGSAAAKLTHPGGNEETPAYVIPTGNGLFPSCLPLSASELQKESAAKTTALFAFIGRLVGKAMIDGRLLDLRLSATFSRLLLSYCRVIYEQERTAHSREGVRVANAVKLGHGKRPVRSELQDIDRNKVWKTFTAGTCVWDLLMDVDSQLANSLRAILDMVRNGQGQAIPNLCLTFVLPGNDYIELVMDGTNKDVIAENAEDFVRRVIYHVLFGGVYQQAEALLRGLEELIDITNLLVFEDRELELFICGPAFEKWNVEYLVQATRCDHGYSHESSSVLHLLKIMSELDVQDQQRFVRFITGSPALPLGGLRNLHPRLTIVRRTPEAGRSPDECLPTVMTCTNYLKLPDYSSFEIAKKQIMYAVREGQGAFHLS